MYIELEPGKLYTKNSIFNKDPNFFSIEEKLEDHYIMSSLTRWLGTDSILYTGKTLTGIYRKNSPNRYSFYEFIHKSKIVYFHDIWALTKV